MSEFYGSDDDCVNQSKDMMDDTEAWILEAAVKYQLPRRSHRSATISHYIQKNLCRISDTHRKLIADIIESSINSREVSPVDISEWERILRILHHRSN